MVGRDVQRFDHFVGPASEMRTKRSRNKSAITRDDDLERPSAMHAPPPCLTAHVHAVRLSYRTHVEEKCNLGSLSYQHIGHNKVCVSVEKGHPVIVCK